LADKETDWPTLSPNKRPEKLTKKDTKQIPNEKKSKKEKSCKKIRLKKWSNFQKPNEEKDKN